MCLPNGTANTRSVEASAGRGLKLLSDPVRGAKRQGKDRQRRVGPAGRREEGASGNVRMRERVSAPPPGGHAAAGVAPHAGRPHMVEAADRMRTNQVVADPALVRA